mmetsp:Transcript_839/g.1408  ORF Transcript_839/g.1408 Transcript_839/m.1408 type:complete len:203 (-) Transcript_839:412-1020(-)
MLTLFKSPSSSRTAKTLSCWKTNVLLLFKLFLELVLSVLLENSSNVSLVTRLCTCPTLLGATTFLSSKTLASVLDNMPTTIPRLVVSTLKLWWTLSKKSLTVRSSFSTLAPTTPPVSIPPQSNGRSSPKLSRRESCWLCSIPPTKVSPLETQRETSNLFVNSSTMATTLSFPNLLPRTLDSTPLVLELCPSLLTTPKKHKKC